MSPALAGEFFTTGVTWEALKKSTFILREKYPYESVPCKAANSHMSGQSASNEDVMIIMASPFIPFLWGEDLFKSAFGFAPWPCVLKFYAFSHIISTLRVQVWKFNSVIIW